MAGQAGPKKKKCCKKVHRDSKTRHYVKDVDQIHDELAAESSEPSKKRKRPIDPDLPGLGQFYSAETCHTGIGEDILWRFQGLASAFAIQEIATCGN